MHVRTARNASRCPYLDRLRAVCDHVVFESLGSGVVGSCSHKAAGAASSLTTPKPDMSQVIQPIIRFGDDACAAYMQAPFENCEMRTVVAFFVTDE